jgi:hypothetical protein
MKSNSVGLKLLNLLEPSHLLLDLAVSILGDSLLIVEVEAVEGDSSFSFFFSLSLWSYSLNKSLSPVSSS